MSDEKCLVKGSWCTPQKKEVNAGGGGGGEGKDKKPRDLTRMGEIMERGME